MATLAPRGLKLSLQGVSLTAIFEGCTPTNRLRPYEHTNFNCPSKCSDLVYTLTSVEQNQTDRLVS